jgi:hypothetical protein
MSLTTKIQVKNSQVAGHRPLTSNLTLGELAVNTDPNTAGIYMLVQNTTVSPAVTQVIKIGPVAVGTTAPISDNSYTQGEFWYDTNYKILKVYVGSNWIKASGPTAAIGISPPANALAGDLWWSSDDAVLKIYYQDPSGDSYWVDASPNSLGGGGGAMVSTATRQYPGIVREVRDAGDGLGYVTFLDLQAAQTARNNVYLSNGNFNTTQVWQTGYNYNVYNLSSPVLVSYGGLYYQVTTNHTSSVFAQDLENGYLKEVSWDDSNLWSKSTGNIVIPTGIDESNGSKIYHGALISLANLRTWNATPNNADILLQASDPTASGFVTLGSLGEAADYVRGVIGDINIYCAPGFYSLENADFGAANINIDGSKYASPLPLNNTYSSNGSVLTYATIAFDSLVNAYNNSFGGTPISAQVTSSLSTVSGVTVYSLSLSNPTLASQITVGATVSDGGTNISTATPPTVNSVNTISGIITISGGLTASNTTPFTAYFTNPGGGGASYTYAGSTSTSITNSLVVFYQPLRIAADMSNELGYQLYTRFNPGLRCGGGTIANVLFMGTIAALSCPYIAWSDTIGGQSIGKSLNGTTNLTALFTNTVAALNASNASFQYTYNGSTTVYNLSAGNYLTLHRGNNSRITVVGGRLKLNNVFLGAHTYATDNSYLIGSIPTSINYGNKYYAPYISLENADIDISGLILFGNEQWNFPNTINSVSTLPTAKFNSAIQYGFAASLIGARGICRYIHNGTGVVNQAIYLLPNDTGSVSSAGLLWTGGVSFPTSPNKVSLAGTTSYLSSGTPNSSWTTWNSMGPMIGSYFYMHTGGNIELQLEPSAVSTDQNGFAGAFGYLEYDPNTSAKSRMQGFSASNNAGIGFTLPMLGGGTSNISNTNYITPWVPVSAGGTARIVTVTAGTDASLYAYTLNVEPHRFLPGITAINASSQYSNTFLMNDQSSVIRNSPGNWGAVSISTYGIAGLEV